MVRSSFMFLETHHAFKETTDKELVIPEWIERGVAYTDNNFVIVFCDDLLEKSFTTIIYKIGSNRKIPIFEKSYFTLESFLTAKGDTIGVSNSVYYKDFDSLKACVATTASYIKQYNAELLSSARI